MGLSEADWRRMAPPLTRDNDQVLDVWAFCEGWNPERLAIAVEYFGVRDVDALIDGLQVLRDTLRKHAKAQQEVSHGPGAPR